MNLLLIKNICEKKGVTIRSLAASIGMTEQNIHACVKKNEIKAGDLEKIAEILEVSIGLFFEMEDNIIVSVKGSDNQVQHGTGNTIQGSPLQKEVDHLNKLLVEKDKIIEEKERLIQILMSK